MSIIDANTHAHPDTPTAATGGSPQKRKPAKPTSEARLRANRQNAKKSTRPRTETGKQRSSLNATRHGILSQVIHLPRQEMKAYDEFTREYVQSLSPPIGAVEIQLGKPEHSRNMVISMSDNRALPSGAAESWCVTRIIVR